MIILAQGSLGARTTARVDAHVITPLAQQPKLNTLKAPFNDNAQEFLMFAVRSVDSTRIQPCHALG